MVASFCTDILSSKKKQCRDLAKTINLTKEEIDQTRQAIDKIRNDRAEQGEFFFSKIKITRT